MTKSKDMDRPTKKYILNLDLKHFNESEYGMYKGVTLTKYYGTLEKAYKKGVPVYNQKGKLTHKPKLKAKIDKTTWVCSHCGQWNSITNDKTCHRCGTPRK